MAPAKSTTRAVSKQASADVPTMVHPMARKALTRRAAQNTIDPNIENMQTRGKRKAENSPIKNDKIKRSALGTLTNNVKVMTLQPEEDAKQQHTKKVTKQNIQTVPEGDAGVGATTSMPPPTSTAVHAAEVEVEQSRVVTRTTSKAEEAIENCHKVLDKFEEMLARPKRKVTQKKPTGPPTAPMIIPVLPIPKKISAHKPVRRISNEFNKTEESLYMSALEDVSSCESMRLSGNFEAARRRSEQTKNHKQKTDENNKIDDADVSDIAEKSEVEDSIPTVPDGVEDFDKVNWNDPFQVSHYASDIFNYLKTRESKFPITDYMEKQIHLSKWMRSLLVDWMVEVQETFELNHETLYLAVKVVDLYLCRVVINKEKLQLLGAAALFIACKFDERTPPLIEDFLYICDGAYKHEELVHMEMETLRTIDYDLGIPLSYRFLRRYARCAKVQMPTLTLARYILELSLMDYGTISYSDSKMASAALFMALRLHGEAIAWTSTLIHYTGYNLADFAEIVPVLNSGLHRKPKGTIKTIRSKYSHKIFHEVAKVQLLTNEKLFENNLDLNISSTT